MSDHEGQSPLDRALNSKMLYKEEGCINIVQYLKRLGCSSESKVKHICGACRWGKFETVKKLVEQDKKDLNGKHTEVDIDTP